MTTHRAEKIEQQQFNTLVEKLDIEMAKPVSIN